MTPEEIARLPYRRNVGVMLANAGGHIFVGQRYDSLIPAWQMPQGGIDGDERPDEAAMRELEEETGVSPSLVTLEAQTSDWLSYDLPLDLVPRIWNGCYRGQEQKWVLFRFHGKDSDINIATPHPEFSDWRWLPPAEVAKQIVPFKRAVYDRVLEEFAPHL